MPVGDGSPPLAGIRHKPQSSPGMARTNRTSLPSEDHATPLLIDKSLDSKSVRGRLPSAPINTTLPGVATASVRLSGLTDTAPTSPLVSYSFLTFPVEMLTAATPPPEVG